MLQLGTEKIDLTRIPLFQGVESAAFGGAAEWVFYFRDGQKIFTQGEPAKSMIVILRGEIQVLSQDMSMVTRRQSDVVGEQGFLSSKACRTADAFARGTVEVLKIPGAVVRRLMEINLQFNRNLLQIVSGKLAEATSDRAYRYRNESRLIAAFGAHLSPEITSRLLSSGEEYGKPRLIDGVVLFADIRGFTSTSMMLPPDQLASELGGYTGLGIEVLVKPTVRIAGVGELKQCGQRQRRCGVNIGIVDRAMLTRGNFSPTHGQTPLCCGWSPQAKLLDRPFEAVSSCRCSPLGQRTERA